MNGSEYVGELRYMHVPTNAIPGFALMGPENRPTDYINGGEWDDDIPKNIAPVLGPFLRGSYTKRRHPWEGARREDETAL